MPILLLRRLKQLPPPGPEVAQDLADALFRHFDLGLREMGVSDIAVPRRMRDLAEAFLGRARAYNAALDETGAAGQAALAAALSRNVLGGAGDGARLAAFVRDLDAGFAQMPLAEILEGPIFPAKAA